MQLPRLRLTVRWLIAAVAIVAVSIGAAKWWQRERRLRAIARARFSAASGLYPIALHRFQTGQLDLPELYVASCRVLEAQRGLDRAAAARAHRDRMRSLYLEATRWRGLERPDSYLLLLAYDYVLEAEYWLALEDAAFLEPAPQIPPPPFPPPTTWPPPPSGVAPSPPPPPPPDLKAEPVLPP